MISAQQHDDVTVLIRDVADTVIRPYYKNLKDGDVAHKNGEWDPVTVADKLAEEHLKEGLLRILPESLFVGEESCHADPGLLSCLSDPQRPVWVVDPIDGTSNFTRGEGGFGPMVCLLHGGKVLASWLYNVLTDVMSVLTPDGRVLINGERHQPVLSPEKPYKGQLGWKLCKSPLIKSLDLGGHLQLFPNREPSVEVYFNVLQGKMDFLIFRFTNSWDHLPGIGILSACGAVLYNWDGDVFQATEAKGLLIARSEDAAQSAMKYLVTPLKQGLSFDHE